MNIIVIPARLNSTRLPQKLLLSDTGTPLICHTISRALESQHADLVVVATDSQRIKKAVEENQPGQRVHVVVTGPCPDGTSRIVESLDAVETMFGPVQTVVNLQGDEPDLSGKYLDLLFVELAKAMIGPVDCELATLCARATADELASPDVVKVVFDHYGKAMYFSRSPIPYGGDGFRHIGAYAYPRKWLGTLGHMKHTTLTSEKLEQLRWLQSGVGIKVIQCDVPAGLGIDTKADYEAFVRRWKARKRTAGGTS